MDSSPPDRRAARTGTAIVLVHLAISLVHGVAHQELNIGLSIWEIIFVRTVILTGPLLAMALLWSRRLRAGAALLAATMAGSLIFGVYHHFVATGPDHVASQAPNGWGITFVVTAGLLFIVEAVGAYAGARMLFARAPQPTAIS